MLLDLFCFRALILMIWLGDCQVPYIWQINKECQNSRQKEVEKNELALCKTMTRKAENENIIARLQTGLLGRPGRRGGASFIYPGHSSACFLFCPLPLHAPAFPGLVWQGQVLSLSGAAQGSPTQHTQLPPPSLPPPILHRNICPAAFPSGSCSTA